MTSIERTAYPRFSSEHTLKTQDKEDLYSLTQQEQDYIKANIRGDAMRLNFTILLKLFQRLGYFPEIKDISEDVVNHLKQQ